MCLSARYSNCFELVSVDLNRNVALQNVHLLEDLRADAADQVTPLAVGRRPEQLKDDLALQPEAVVFGDPADRSRDAKNFVAKDRILESADELIHDHSRFLVVADPFEHDELGSANEAGSWFRKKDPMARM